MFLNKKLNYSSNVLFLDCFFLYFPLCKLLAVPRTFVCDLGVINIFSLDKLSAHINCYCPFSPAFPLYHIFNTTTTTHLNAIKCLRLNLQHLHFGKSYFPCPSLSSSFAAAQRRYATLTLFFGVLGVKLILDMPYLEAVYCLLVERRGRERPRPPGLGEGPRQGGEAFVAQRQKQQFSLSLFMLAMAISFEFNEKH